MEPTQSAWCHKNVIAILLLEEVGLKKLIYFIVWSCPPFSRSWLLIYVGCVLCMEITRGV